MIYDWVVICINCNFVFVWVGGLCEQILKLFDQCVYVVLIFDGDGWLVDVFSCELFNLFEESEVFVCVCFLVWISFFGGGIDLMYYFVENDGGVVINVMIKMYVYVMLWWCSDFWIWIYLYDFCCMIEVDNFVEFGMDGEFVLIKLVICLIKLIYGFEFEVLVDFLVGLGFGGLVVVIFVIIGCFNEFCSDQWDCYEIVEMVFQVEWLMLNIFGGWQD